MATKEKIVRVFIPRTIDDMTVLVYRRPPSDVKELHPAAQAGEWYGAYEHSVVKREQIEHDLVGPAASKVEALVLLRALVAERKLSIYGNLALCEIIDETEYWMEEAARKIVDALWGFPEDQAKTIIDAALTRHQQNLAKKNNANVRAV